MPYVLLGLLFAVAGWAWLRTVPPEGRKSALITMGLLTLVIGFLFIGLTGRLPALLGALAAAVPFLRRIIPGFLIWRWLRRFSPQARNGAGRASPGQSSGAVSRQEALDILGLEASPSEEEIVQAHRRLMQRLHPDRGGSDYLAARINEAKKVLLDHRQS